MNATVINSLRQEFNDRIEGYRADIKKWENFIRDILESSEVQRIGILLHFYEQGCECEKFEIKEIKSFNINLVNSNLLLKLKEDILYFFSK